MVKSMVAQCLETLWYQRHWGRWLLWPAALLYQSIVAARRFYLQRFAQHTFPVPIIVVGNLTVGGVGKTPLVLALAKKLQARGWRVGIVSRGYGAHITHFPHEVQQHDMAFDVGDEPLLLANQAGCPVVIAPERCDAVQYLLDKHQSQIVISDDGLQHYAMGRAIEIAVIDGVRGLGNGLCLPAGPLREKAYRLQQVDFVVVNQAASNDVSVVGNAYRMALLPGAITSLIKGHPIEPAYLKKPIAAVAAIGHPQRFFSLLQHLQIPFKPYPFLDHHVFTPKDLLFAEKVVVMTEKDAVKCQSFATDSMYYLPVEAQVEDPFWEALWQHKQLQIQA